MSKTDWTIPDLLQLSGGYWGSLALHVGVRLDVFTQLAGVNRSAEDIADACKCDIRGMEMLLDALAALGLLEKSTEGYTATSFSSEVLVKNLTGYLGNIIMHHHNLVSGWSLLHEAVRTGCSVRDRISHSDDEQSRENFQMGMFDLANQLAPRIAETLSLAGCQRLLDLGGGAGTYAIHFCRRFPDMKAVVYDLPTTRTFAETVIAEYDLQSRISFVAGDFHSDSVPDGFDVVWLSHILHADGPEACAMILQKGVEALVEGGELYIQEFILDNTKDSPVFPALFSLNMLVGTSAGRSYSEAELRIMMSNAGLSSIRRLPIQLPNGAGIISGIK